MYHSESLVFFLCFIYALTVLVSFVISGKIDMQRSVFQLNNRQFASEFLKARKPQDIVRSECMHT